VKLLFDENLSPRLVQRLEPAYPGSAHVDLVGLHGKTDAEIWEFAGRETYTIVSKDNDFRQLSVLYGTPPKVVWLSVGNVGTAAIADLLEERGETGGISAGGGGEKGFQMLAHHLMEHGAFGLAGRVSQGGDGGAAFIACGGLASHEPRSWQPYALTASLRVGSRRSAGRRGAGASADGHNRPAGDHP
jgi:predicted nuclease of predicted toxin-antitoxin system